LPSATRRGIADTSSDSQSIGSVTCYTFTPDRLIRVPTLPYRPEFYAQPYPFSIAEDQWEALYADRLSGMTLAALAEKWSTRLITISRTLNRYEANLNRHKAERL
jgi:hypothetical protein